MREVASCAHIRPPVLAAFAVETPRRRVFFCYRASASRAGARSFLRKVNYLAHSSSTAKTNRPPAAHSGRRGWIAQIFGLELHGRFAAPWVTSGAEAPFSTPVVRAHVVSDGEVGELWCDEGADRLVNWRFDDGSTLLAIDRHPDLGYRMCAHRQGVHVVSADGSRIWSCPSAPMTGSGSAI
jgi:hypothetical protein